jgi:hypothetical protein
MKANEFSLLNTDPGISNKPYTKAYHIPIRKPEEKAQEERQFDSRGSQLT